MSPPRSADTSRRRGVPTHCKRLWTGELGRGHRSADTGSRRGTRVGDRAAAPLRPRSGRMRAPRLERRRRLRARERGRLLSESDYLDQMMMASSSAP